MIGSVENARTHGASGEDAEVVAALLDALERIEGYCSDKFEPITDARYLQVADGFARATIRLRSVTSVATIAPDPRTIPTSGWRLVPRVGAVTSGPDYLGIELSVSGADGLIAGAEPWNGGYANLIGSDIETVEVAGEWGWTAPPATVVAAVEQLAGYLAAGPYVPQADAEGNPLGQPTDGMTARTATDPPPEKVAAAGRTEETTGLASVDRAVKPYRRRGFRIN